MAISVEACLAVLDVNPPTEATLTALLSPDERQRAFAFRSSRDRARYAVCRGRLRELLAERLGGRPEVLTFAYNAFGKPLVPGARLHFNLSHAGGVALYVMARDVEVGCDIEWRQPRLASRRAAQWLFSASERKALDPLQGDAWTKGFFNCWTRKEAVLKGHGVGLTQPSDFEAAATLRGADGWSVLVLEPMPGLHAAIAVHASDWRLTSLQLLC
jgi:4'-phosphopantetheinyl transferase